MIAHAFRWRVSFDAPLLPTASRNIGDAFVLVQVMQVRDELKVMLDDLLHSDSWKLVSQKRHFEVKCESCTRVTQKGTHQV